MTKYSYILLKYVHDVVREESVNVGLLVVCPEEKFIRLAVRESLADLKVLFTGFSPSNLKRYLKDVSHAFDLYQKEISNQFSFNEEEIRSIAHKVLAPDHSALRWHGNRSGITKDVSETFRQLRGRLIDPPKNSAFERKNDVDVWKKFSPVLKEAKVWDLLEPRQFKIAGFKEKYEHTFKNGKIHCLVPMSLDYSSDAEMLDRIRKEKGRMQLVQEGKRDDLAFYFLLGRPTKRELIKDFEDVRKLLEKSKNTTVISEDEPNHLLKRLQPIVAAHYKGH
jgi:hypothetical protein